MASESHHSVNGPRLMLYLKSSIMILQRRGVPGSTRENGYNHHRSPCNFQDLNEYRQPLPFYLPSGYVSAEGTVCEDDVDYYLIEGILIQVS